MTLPCERCTTVCHGWRWFAAGMLFFALAIFCLVGGGCQYLPQPDPPDPQPTNGPGPDPLPIPTATINAAWFGTWWGSPVNSDEYRRTQLARMRAAGMTAMYLCINSVNGQMLYGEKQDRAYWRYWLTEARKTGMEQIWLWMMDNRSDSINKRSDAWWIAMFQRVDADLGDLVHGYVLGLESEEYLTRQLREVGVERFLDERARLRGSSRYLLAELKRFGKPVGFHTSPGLDSVDYGKGIADEFFLQVAGVDTLTSEAEMTKRCRAAVRAFGGPVVAAEWARYERCGSDLNNRLGDAAIKSDPMIVGVGGGCTAEGLRLLRARAGVTNQPPLPIPARYWDLDSWQEPAEVIR